MHICFLDSVCLGLCDKIAEFADSLVCGAHDIGVVHLKSEITLRYQPRRALVDRFENRVVQSNSKTLSICLFFVKNFDRLKNGFVIFDMGHGGNKVSDVKFLFKFQMLNFSLVLYFNVYVQL